MIPPRLAVVLPRNSLTIGEVDDLKRAVGMRLIRVEESNSIGGVTLVLSHEPATRLSTDALNNGEP